MLVALSSFKVFSLSDSRMPFNNKLPQSLIIQIIWHQSWNHNSYKLHLNWVKNCRHKQPISYNQVHKLKLMQLWQPMQVSRLRLSGDSLRILLISTDSSHLVLIAKEAALLNNPQNNKSNLLHKSLHLSILRATQRWAKKKRVPSHNLIISFLKSNLSNLKIRMSQRLRKIRTIAKSKLKSMPLLRVLPPMFPRMMLRLLNKIMRNQNSHKLQPRNKRRSSQLMINKTLKPKKPSRLVRPQLLMQMR